MSIISRIKTWVTGDTLTATDLNAEFNNIVNDYNGNITNANISSGAAISTSKIAGTAATLTGTETFTNKTLTTPKLGTSINDTNGNEIIRTPATASAVNDVTITNAATANDPSVSATGDDTNIGLLLTGKGTGKVRLGQATTIGVQLESNQPVLDSSGNEFVRFSKTSSAVNDVTLTNATTGNAPQFAASGDDTNINLDLRGKGNGVVLFEGVTQNTSGTNTFQTGLGMQVGQGALTITSGTSEASLTVNFNRTWTVAPRVFCQLETTGSVFATNAEIPFSNISTTATTTGFTVTWFIRSGNVAANRAINFNWLAVGQF